MLERTKEQTMTGYASLCYHIPADRTDQFKKLVEAALLLVGGKLAGEQVEADERLYAPEEVLPGRTPGRLLRAARNKEDLTQDQLAKMLGVERHHISEMENNKRPIGKEMAKRIEKALGISYKVFL